MNRSDLQLIRYLVENNADDRDLFEALQSMSDVDIDLVEMAFDEYIPEIILRYLSVDPSRLDQLIQGGREEDLYWVASMDPIRFFSIDGASSNREFIEGLLLDAYNSRDGVYTVVPILEAMSRVDDEDLLPLLTQLIGPEEAMEALEVGYYGAIDDDEYDGDMEEIVNDLISAARL